MGDMEREERNVGEYDILTLDRNWCRLTERGVRTDRGVCKSEVDILILTLDWNGFKLTERETSRNRPETKPPGCVSALYRNWCRRTERNVRTDWRLKPQGLSKGARRPSNTATA